MNSRAGQVVRLARCLTTSSKLSQSIFSRESIPRYCNRLATLNHTTRKNSGSSESAENSKNFIETKAFSESVSNLAKSLGLSTTDPESLKPALVHRSYLTTHAATLKDLHAHNDQLAYLGSQTAKRHLTELFLQHFPHLSSQELWDLQNGILENQVLSCTENLQLLKHMVFDSTIYASEAAIQSLMALVAVIYTQEGTERSKQFIYDNLVSNLSESQMQDIIKLQHPKYILKHLSQKDINEPLQLKFLRKNNNKDVKYYKVGVFKEDQCIAVGTGSIAELAEKRACQKALTNVYPEEVKQFNFSYESEDFESEDQIDLGLQTSRQRIITIDKQDKHFGFNIKGGEKKKLKNKDWLEYNYFSPVFISSIQPDGLTDRLGTLRIGDVILAVNDKSLIGADHATAVKVLRESSGIVTLTVQHSKQVLLADRVETDYKKMKQRKRLAELTSEVWAEWHQAQADKYPEKYADVLDFKENHASQ